MDKLQVFAVSGLLNIMFSLTAVMTACPTCPEGYYVLTNCSMGPVQSRGTQCSLCTDCTALNWSTLVPCSTYADAECGSRTTTPEVEPSTQPTACPPFEWIITTAVCASVFLFLVLVFIWIFCRRRLEKGVYLV